MGTYSLVRRQNSVALGVRDRHSLQGLKLGVGWEHLNLNKIFQLSESKAVAHKKYFKPFPNDNILDWSKLKELADNNFKFDGNGRKLSKLIENIEEKEIACYKQFLLFPQCFQKTCSVDT